MPKKRTRQACIAAALLVTASQAMAGAVVSLVPQTPCPYTQGQVVTVDILLTSNESNDVLLRFIQLDFSVTAGTLSPASSVTFDYSGQPLCASHPPSCGTTWQEFPALPRPANIFTIGAEDASWQIVLEPSVPTLVATIDVTVNDWGVLDVMNGGEPHLALGAKLEFDFCPGDQPSTVWRAYSGELTGGTLLLGLDGWCGCCELPSICQNRTSEDCLFSGGVPQEQVCAGVTACCLPGGVCGNTDGICCDDLGGTESAYASACMGDQNGDGCDEACQTYLFVDADASGPIHDGATWCSAFLNLQDALAAAQVGTLIRVGNGTYRPDDGGGQTPGDRDATFQLINGVTIEGGYAGCGAADPDERNTELHETILSGDLNDDDADVVCTQDSPDCDSYCGRCIDSSCIIMQDNNENSYHVVTGSGTGTNALLDGCTVSDGHASGVPEPSSRGGGVYNDGGSPSLTNCLITRNSAFYGGGMINLSDSSPILTNCVFEANATTPGGSAGGMMDLDVSSPVLSNCSFINNIASASGGAFENSASGDELFVNCMFIGNRAGNRGGGMWNAGSPIIINCLFTGNTAGIGGGTYRTGGGIFNNDGDPSLINCTFSGNSAGDSGGGLQNEAGTSTIVGSVFWGNVDVGGTDESAQISVAGGSVFIDYSCVQGWTEAIGGTGNTGADAAFVDADGVDNVVGTEDDDVRLQAGSPCIDSADTSALPADITDLDGDGNTTERIPFDLDGNRRVYDDASVPDTGIPGSAVVDMGAYEVVADCNGNGLPDDCDLACGDPGGLCDLPGCGLSTDYNWNDVPDECDPDCDANGVPDECDITCDTADCLSCPGGCGTGHDCNFNDVLDLCDVPASTGCPDGLCVSDCSSDADENCIPDECVEAGATGANWTDDIWNLSGEYPDNQDSAAGLYPTLDAVEIFLDDTVEIPGLRLLNNAVLHVTQSSVGDLIVVDTGGILAEGTIYVDYDRAIDIPNAPLVVSGDAGRYEADPGVAGPVLASLTAERVTLLPTAGGRTHQMTLTDTMSVTTTGDFVMEAVGSDLIACVSPGGRQVDSRGGRTPPITRISDGAFMTVGADLSLLGAVTFINDSTVPVEIGGDFLNESTAPECFDCLNGSISLTGAESQTFEVAGEDTGQTVAFEDTEFPIRTVDVASETTVTFADTFDNDEQGQGACMESLYVQDLILRAGSTIVLDNCRVYYENLTEEADVTKIYEGCGALLAYCPTSSQPEPELLDLEFDPVGQKIRYLSFHAGDTGQSQAVRVTFSDVPSLYDHWNGTELWVQQPQVYCENAGVAQADPCPESAGGLPSTDFWGAGLGCDPHWTDWTAFEVVHVFNEGITPGGTYDLQVIDSSCSLDVDDNYSDALAMTQSAWADLVQDCTTTPCKPPDGSTGIVDVTAILDKWKNLPGNVKKVRADIEGSPAGDHRVPDQAINITDVTYCLGAFLGDTYPGPGFPPPSDPPDCP